ncbi:MAG: class IV adenylate cyclase [Candidatus Saganbacteria bacterium]|nr:class IV adenylate cyclase [Candidatus Saganbacteria bacterium]
MPEYEVKYKIADKSDILPKLKELGAQDLGEQKETDVYLNFIGKQVRIRKIGQEGLITHKRAIKTSGKAKVREETEVKISDADTMIKIFKGVGFQEGIKKEKIRHTFKLENAHVLIDKLPFMGYFIELEAESEEELKEVSKKLSLDYSNASGDNYMGLFAKYCKENAGKFKNAEKKVLMTFESEKGVLSGND